MPTTVDVMRLLELLQFGYIEEHKSGQIISSELAQAAEKLAELGYVYYTMHLWMLTDKGKELVSLGLPGIGMLRKVLEEE